MAVNSIVEILGIKAEKELLQAIGDFEAVVDINLKPLQDKLKQQVLTSEVQQLELHMTFIESWRDRVARALMLAAALEQHGRSHHFLPEAKKGITSADREAYQRSIIAGAIALQIYLEQLLKSIDSRVMLCKKLLGNEEMGGVNSRRFS